MLKRLKLIFNIYLLTILMVLALLLGVFYVFELNSRIERGDPSPITFFEFLNYSGSCFSTIAKKNLAYGNNPREAALKILLSNEKKNALAIRQDPAANSLYLKKSAEIKMSLSSLSSSQANFTWEDKSDKGTIDHYEIYRDHILIAAVPANTLSFGDSGLKPSTTYIYNMKAVGQDPKPISFSNMVQLTTKSEEIFANTGILTGTVFSNGKPIEGVKITTEILGMEKTTYTSSSGVFMIPNLYAGKYSLIISKNGYKTVTINAQVGAGIVNKQDLFIYKNQL